MVQKKQNLPIISMPKLISRSEYIYIRGGPPKTSKAKFIVENRKLDI